MSARCTRLLLFCLLAGLKPYFSTAQTKLLAEAELDTVRHWWFRPANFNFDTDVTTSYSSFRDLAQQVKAGKRIVAVEINQGVNDWENLKQCRDLQVIGVSLTNENFLDTLMEAVRDLPIQKLRINIDVYTSYRNGQLATPKAFHLTDKLSRLSQLKKVVLSGASFDWEDSFRKLATVSGLRSLQLTGFYYGTGANTPTTIAGISALHQLTQLTIGASPTTRFTPELGQLTQLRTLIISVAGDQQQDTSQVIARALPNLTNLESLTIPVKYLPATSAGLEKLTHLRRLYVNASFSSNNESVPQLPALNKLPDLEELALSSLRLKTWPEGLCSLKKLRKLLLNGNQIRSIPGCLANLEQLETLNLSANPIGSLPQSIQSLKRLKELNATFCKLDSVADVFANLQQLTSLNLASNQFSQLPATVWALSELRTLDLRQNKLRQLPATVGLKKITFIDISANQLRNLPASLGTLTSLTALLVSGNSLTQLPPSIGELKNLVNLNLGSNKLAQLPVELGKLRRLKMLILNNNELAVLPESLFKLDSLTMLHVHQNRLTTLPQQIGHWQRLTDLNIQQNPLTVLPESIGQLTKLRGLVLVDMPLQALPTTIGKLNELRNLTISKTKIRLLPTEIGYLTRLRSLSLMDNELMALPDEIGKCQELINLSLRGNRLTGLPNTIGRLKKLQNLSIIGSRENPTSMLALPDSIVLCKGLWSVMIMQQPELDADDAFQKLAQLPILQSITIMATKLSRWPETDWKKSMLQTLNLSQNALTTVPTALLDASTLMMIDLHENPLPKPLDAVFSSKDQLRIALAEIGQISLESSAKPNWSVANGFMQSSRRKSSQGDWSGTLDDLSKAIDYAPDSMASIVYSQRAEFQFFRKNFSEAIADFDKALSYWPKLTNSVSGPNNAGRGQETRNRLRATWWTRKAMARGNLAQYEAALKDADQAAQLLPALSATPNREDAQAAGMVHIERGRFQLLTNHRKEMLESFGKAMDAYEKMTYSEPGTQLTVVELGIISQQYDRATKALDKIDEYQRREGFATLFEYLKTCLAVLKDEQKPAQATETMQAYVRNHGSQITGWSFDLFDAWLNGADLPLAKMEALKQVTATVKERLVKME